MSSQTKSSITESIVAALPNAVLVFDANGLVHHANHALKGLLISAGIKPTGVSHINQIFDPTSSVLGAVGALIASGRSMTLYDVPVLGQSALVISATQMPEMHGFYLLSIQTASPQIKQEADLCSSSLLAQMLAHEIKNPLAGIQAAAQLLEQSSHTPEDKELLTLIGREINRILRLVKNVDTIESGIASESFRSINVHEVLERVVSYARTAFGDSVVIEEKYDPSLPDIDGDFDSLVQAFMNLVKNAAEAFDAKNGRIVLRTRYDHAAPYHARHMDKIPLCIEIEDNGCGIEPCNLKKIFMPRFSTKSGGEGLGLPIVSRIIDNHGAVLDVTSEKGKTVFRANFPVGQSQYVPKQQGRYA